jgi:hypothetical protein
MVGQVTDLGEFEPLTLDTYKNKGYAEGVRDWCLAKVEVALVMGEDDPWVEVGGLYFPVYSQDPNFEPFVNSVWNTN